MVNMMSNWCNRIQLQFPLSKYAKADLLTFFLDRLRIQLRDQDLRHDVIDAVLALPDQDDIFSKADAANVVKSFFAKYKVTSFSLKHQGSSKGKSSEYAIGDMVASGKKFRVFIYINENGGNTLIQQIQFEQD